MTDQQFDKIVPPDMLRSFGEAVRMNKFTLVLALSSFAMETLNNNEAFLIQDAQRAILLVTQDMIDEAYGDEIVEDPA